MKKFILLFIAMMSMTTTLVAQISDNDIIALVNDGLRQGKSQQQITRELMTRGVTKAQFDRIKAEYDARRSAQTTQTKAPAEDVTRTNPETQDDVDTDMAGDKEVNEDYIRVFGRDIFRDKNLTFEPSMNMATPQNYRLGPGDQVVIEVWGASESRHALKISPDGYINIPEIGPVSLNGLTVQEATSRIKSQLSRIYAGMGTTNVDVSTNVKVTLGQIRTIVVNIMGEVSKPGTYALSSFSTAFHALYKAGGVSSLGSLRNIKVVRGGQTVTEIDVYDYILRGRSNTDIRLQEGDVVLVSPYSALVKIDGNIKRPMYYEMKKGETLGTILDYAGGFTSDAYSRSLTIERNNGIEKTVSTVNEMDFSDYRLQDGDIVSVGSILQRYANRVEVKGAVYRPGFYEIGKDITSVRDLIEKADGPLEEAFLDHAMLHRENNDKTLEVIPVDLKGIMEMTVADIPLHKNDVLFIPSIHDMKDQGTIEVFGDVFAPGIFPYAANTKIEDIIIQAGGLLESASAVRIDVSRRINDPKSTKKQKAIAENFTFSVKDGFVIDGEAGFLLKPYDQVYVRRSPGYSPQIKVTVSGEVEFEGSYSLSERNERLSDVIKKAGGLSDFAYVPGARLERVMSEEEYLQARDMLEIIQVQNHDDEDSVRIDEKSIKRIYGVAIDLRKALDNPHSDSDLALREGDVIIIPQYSNTVTVRGTVRKPNTITYDPSKNLSYYINEAGGWGDRAKKRAVFTVHPNGHIKKLGARASAKDIEPGAEIIVPQKHKSSTNVTTVIAAITSSVSALSVIGTLVITMLRK